VQPFTEPKVAFADIVWARHTYSDRRLVLRMRLRDVLVRRDVGTYISWSVRGPRDSGLGVQVLWDPAGPSPDLTTTDITNTRGVDYKCAGARTTVSARTATFTLAIPKQCLPGAPWVRVAAGVMVQDLARGGLWHDDPRVGDDLPIKYNVADHPEGPRLYRG
jgi:hypothetical protein